MFVLRKNMTCRWPVKVIEPHPEKAGETTESEFTIELLIIDRDQREANDRERQRLLDVLQAAETPADIVSARDALRGFADERYREAIVGWSGIEDDERKPFEFSSEALSILLSNDYVRRAIDVAYNEAVTLDKGRAKN